MKIIHALNYFFFDVEDHPETDWAAVFSFYGVMILAIIIGIGVWFL